jgi:hypothetical protein
MSMTGTSGFDFLYYVTLYIILSIITLKSHIDKTRLCQLTDWLQTGQSGSSACKSSEFCSITTPIICLEPV